MKESYKNIIRNYFTTIYRFFLIITGDVNTAKKYSYQLFVDIYKEGKLENEKISLLQKAHYLISKNVISDSFKIDRKQLETIGLKDDLVNTELITNIFNNLTNLKQQYIETSILRFIEGLSSDDISKIMKLTQQEVDTTIGEILSYLELKLNEGKETKYKLSKNDIAINISKLSKFNIFIPEIEYIEELIHRLNNESIKFDKQLSITETEIEKSKHVIESRKKIINWKLLIFILIAILIAYYILSIIF